MTNLIKTPSFEIATYVQGNPDAERLALVMPGRLDTKDYLHMRSHVDFLAELGFLALSFDPPGTWESPGDTDLYTMTNYLKAIDELIEFYGNKPTFLLGHSRGGSMALIAGPKNPSVTRFAAIMSQAKGSTPSVGKSVREGNSEVSRRDVPGNPTQTKLFRVPLTYYEDAAKYDATEGLADSSKPKLFVYGTEDELIPRSIVEDIYTGAIGPKEIHGIVSGHDYRLDSRAIDEVNVVIQKFLSVHPA